MLDLFYDLHQNRGISQAKSDARQAQSKAQGNAREMMLLEQKLERTMMVCESLWNIVKESHGLEDDDLAKMVKAIDLEDGRADNKVKKSPPIQCKRCGKTVPRTRTTCMYCGEEHTVSPFKR